MLREKKAVVREWTKQLAPMVITGLLAAAVIGTLVFWPQGFLSGRKAEFTANEVDSTRQAAERKLAEAQMDRVAAVERAADAEKARQAAEARTVDAEKALQSAQAQVAAGEKARQFALAQASDAEKARQAAEAKAADAEKARQAAEAKLADVVNTRQPDAKSSLLADTVNYADANGPATVASRLFDRKINTQISGGASVIPGAPGAHSSAEHCVQICADNRLCMAYSHNKQSQICYIYYSLNNYKLIADANYDSGIRTIPAMR